MSSPKAWAAVFIGMSCFALGCQSNNDAIVVGEVRIDGSLLPEGEIIFEAVNQDSTPAGSTITAGQYEVAVPPGAKIVRINASRPTKIPDPLMGAAARESMVEPEFNLDSKLRAEIKPGRNTGVNFEVKSLP